MKKRIIRLLFCTLLLCILSIPVFAEKIIESEEICWRDINEDIIIPVGATVKLKSGSGEEIKNHKITIENGAQLILDDDYGGIITECNIIVSSNAKLVAEKTSMVIFYDCKINIESGAEFCTLSDGCAGSGCKFEINGTLSGKICSQNSDFIVHPGGVMDVSQFGVADTSEKTSIQADQVSYSGVGGELKAHSHLAPNGKCAVCGATVTGTAQPITWQYVSGAFEPITTGSVLSEGSLWLVLTVAVLAVAVVVLFLAKRKKAAGSEQGSFESA